MDRPRTRLAALVFALLAVSCAGPDRAYLAADRATFEQVGPRFQAYVSADATLSEDLRRALALVVDTWRVRLEHAEAAR